MQKEQLIKVLQYHPFALLCKEDLTINFNIALMLICYIMMQITW